MKTLTKLKAVVFLTLGFALLPNLASASMTPAEYPWPWPWAIGCPIRLTDLVGAHAAVTSSQQVDTYQFTFLRNARDSQIDLHVRRIDSEGLHSDGHANIRDGRQIFYVMMNSYREHRLYKIQVRMGMFNTFETPKRPVPPAREPAQCDDRAKVKTVITIIPEKTSQTGANYFLEPIQN